MSPFWQRLAIATNWPILVAVTVLPAIGIVTIWEDNPADAKKQIAFLLLGWICMFLFQTVNYLKLGRYAWTFYILSLLLLLYTDLPHVPRSGIGAVPVIKGSHKWISFGAMSLEPTELMKVGYCVAMARYLRFRSNYRTVLGMAAPFALTLAPVALILKQPDLGSALIFPPALFALLFVAGAKLKHLLGIVFLGAVLVPVAWFAGPAPDGPDVPFFRHLPVLLRPYQRARVVALFSRDPEMMQKEGFQAEIAARAISTGHFTGKGVGVIPIGKYVPEGHNDMIFSLIGEQFGFIGILVLMAGFIVLFVAGIEIAAGTREPFGRLVAVGTVSLLASQAFMNMMVTVRLMPVTGVTLPFVSYGGSSLLASFLSAGLLLNIGQNRPLVMSKQSFEFD